MDVITPYVGQGALSIVVGEKEAIIVDTFVPPQADTDAVFMKALLARVLRGKRVVGLLLTGLDCDHADPRGVAWILGMYRPTWVMYPRYKKLTGRAGEVFKRIKDHELARANTAAPLLRHSIRLDRIDERVFTDLCTQWDIEVFSPHPEDMTSSNNVPVRRTPSLTAPGGRCYWVGVWFPSKRRVARLKTLASSRC